MPSSHALDAVRRAFAEDICTLAGVRSPRLVEALAPGGRLLVPLTVSVPHQGFGGGHMWLVTKQPTGLTARFVSTVGIFDCIGARSDEGERLLRAAYVRGGQERVRSLPTDAHAAGPHCWLHGARFCLSDVPD